MRITTSIPFIIAGVAMVAGSYAFLTTSVPYVSAREAQFRQGQPVHVAGQLVRGTEKLRWDSGILEFDMKDADNVPLHVVYKGPKPANFDTAPKISVAGCYKEGAFQADQILVKCPSKYESKGQADAQAKESAAPSKS